MSASTPSTPAARFAGLIAGLCAYVAASLERPAMLKPGLPGPLIVLIWRRLSRIAQRFAKIAAKVEAGTLKPPRRRPARPHTTPRTARRKPPPDGPALPRGFGWLGQLVPQTRYGARHLAILLDDPEMQALIAAAPQIGRILRPLCHILRLDPPPLLRLPPRPEKPAPKRETRAGRRPKAEPRLVPSSRPRQPPRAPEVARPDHALPASA